MEDNKLKPYIYLPLVFALLLIIGIFIGMKLNNSGTGEDFFHKVIPMRNSDASKINDILEYIEEQYVDTINKGQLVESSLREIMQNLDPHSAYITAEELKAANEPLQGNFEGIGIEFAIIKDTIRVISAISGGPSEAAGILAGDKIVKIEGKNVAGVKIANQDVMKSLRGTGGTKVSISILRKGIKKLLDITITRGTIPIYSVDIAYMTTPEIGYIKISRFGSTTYEEYVQAFDKLQEKGMKKLIVDLRGNPGGLLNAAVDISDEFLEKNKQIVYTEGKAHPKKIYTATAKGLFEKNGLVILIDEGSASASEIVAGAVQDNDRGTVVGRRSFGKGLVQEQSEFPDGSAIRLTISRYYTPTGRSIQKPYTEGTDVYYREEYERFEHGEMESADSIKFVDSLKFTTPGGRVVYGGGGIMPDVFVSLDTTGRTSYLVEVSSKGLLNQFAFEYADKKRESFRSKYKTIESYNKEFVVDEQVMNELIAFAEKGGVKSNEQQIKHSKKIIQNQVKAIVARNIWGNEGFYPVLHSSDNTFLEAVKQLSK